MWYHGTSEKAYNSIMKEGFKIIPSSSNRFGNGVYFSDQNDISYYGNNTIVSEIKLNALTLTPDQWFPIEDKLIRQHGNDYNQYISTYIKELGYNSLIIQWNTGKELIVYNVNIISIINQEVAA